MEDVPVYLNSFQNMNVSPHPQPGLRVCLSADEAAIRRRGKRRIPASFSPERPEDGPVLPRAGSPSEVGRPRREMQMVVARKKLFGGGDLPGQADSVSGDTSPASPAKKVKTTTELSFTINNNDPISETPKKMAALSKGQLVKLVSDMTLKDPSLMEKISPLVPQVPDITGQLASLEKQGQNVFKAMPLTRLSNHHDSISYNRVQLHLKTFHQVLVDDLSSLVMSEHWPTVIRYVMSAWRIVDKSPVWEDSLHNKARVSCFRNLANVGIKAIKSYQFEESVREKLLYMMVISANMELQGQIHVLKSL